MLNFIFAVLLLILALLALTLLKTFLSWPSKELRRKAKSGDSVALELFRAAAYEGSLEALLWIVATVTAAAACILLVQAVPAVISFIAVVLFLLIGFWIIPTRAVGKRQTYVARRCSRVLAFVLHYLHRPLLFLHRHAVAIGIGSDTGIYDAEDLSSLLAAQKDQPGNRVSPETIAIMERVLRISDTQLSDVMEPIEDCDIVLPEDILGPVLIDELHSSNRAVVPVLSSVDERKVIGMLETKKLGIDSKGTAADNMDTKLYYLHEKNTLTDALHALHATNAAVFVILDEADETVGIVSIDRILHAVLGTSSTLPSEVYSDPSMVQDASISETN